VGGGRRTVLTAFSSCRQVRLQKSSQQLPSSTSSKKILEKSGAVKNPVSYYLFEENWYAVAFGVKVLIAVA
jgi:hypothetical protein